MIEWHKVVDELPPYEVDVLVCDSLSGYTDVYVACLEKDEDEDDGDVLLWLGTDGSVGAALYDDYWAYINLPVKDGDSD